MFSLAHLHLLPNHWSIILPMLALLLLAVSWIRRAEPPALAGALIGSGLMGWVGLLGGEVP